MGVSFKGVTASLTLSTRRILNKKHKASTVTTDFVLQDVMKILEDFKDVPYLGCSKRQVKNVLLRLISS